LAGLAGTAGTSDGTGNAARFNVPGGIALDNSGNIIVADTNNFTIRKVTPAGVVTTIAGTAGTHGSTGGTSALFYYPSNVAVDSSGSIYVADATNQLIRKITFNGTTASTSTLAGSVGRTGYRNATGTGARFDNPLGVAVDSSGTVYVADATNNLIRKVTSSGVVTTLAGGGSSTGTTAGSTDGTGNSALFNFPVDVAVDGSGNLYVADTNNDTIRKIVTSTGVVTTIAGTAGSSGSTDGVGTSARFNAPSGVRVDSAGNIYIADTNNQTIRKLTPAGLVTTIAGTVGTSGSTDGVGSAALFYSPSNARPDASGTVYVIDTNNDTLRKGVPSAVPAIQAQPTNQSVVAGQNATFTVAVTGNPAPSYQWQRLPAGSATWTSLTDGGAYAGSATATLTITAANLAMSGDQFRCVATNAVGSATSNSVSLTVGVAPEFTSAASTTFTVGQAGGFTVTATGTPAPTFSATGLPSWATLNATTGALTGTPTSTSGTPFTINLTASNGFAPAATEALTLNVKSTLASWQSRYFGASANTPAIAGPTAVPSGNGIPNLLQYAIGGNPLSVTPTVPLPAVALATDPADGEPHLTLTATLDATTSGITISGQVSADLRTWYGGTNYVQVVSDTTVGTVRTLILRDATALGVSPNHYLRLQVTQP
jgi:sugar lactone lactonase YvrE